MNNQKNNQTKKLTVGVIFGGKSVEHDVSIVSAQIVMEGLRKSGKYEIAPIYITKKGNWICDKKLQTLEAFEKLKLKESFISKKEKIYELLDSSLDQLVILKERKGLFIRKIIQKIDVAFPVMHGTFGEDGSLQGFLEMLQVPYVGCGVLASSLAMDKVITKTVFQANNIPIVKYLWFLKRDWQKDPEKIYQKIEKELKYPIFVKPANLGSSIGISRAMDRKQLSFAFEVATQYDTKIIAEEGIVNLMEINCAILGNESPVASVLEQPISCKEFLTFDEKYLNKGGTMKGIKSKVKIPAPLPEEKRKEIQELAIRVFKVLNCTGTARIDFLVDQDTEKVYVNEVNPMPGTLQQHLWKASGIDLPKLVDRLINLALERHKERSSLFYTFDSNIA